MKSTHEKKSLSPKELEKCYFEETTSWEIDRLTRIAKSERRAWIVAGASIVTTVLSLIALAAITPLKTVEPYVIRVDNTTGNVDIVTTLKESQNTYGEVVDRYFLIKYLRHRERYLPETMQEDRQIVGLMSNPIVSQTYANLTDPRRNPNAPIALYSDQARVRVEIKSITFIAEKTAMIRYSNIVERAGRDGAPTHWVATVTYEYLNTPISEGDRHINPLGFQVTDYRTDPEIL